MEKLELKDYLNYVLYGVQMYWEELDGTPKKPWQLSLLSIPYALKNKNKMILHPLSDYTDINSDGMNALNIDVADQIVLCDYANKQISIQSVTVGVYQIMCENQIDMFNLIGRGLAVDVNTIEV